MSDQDEQENVTQDSTTETDETTQENASEQSDESQEDESEATEDWRENFDADKAAERIKKYQSENKNLRTRAKEAEKKAEGVDEKDKRISALEATNLRYEVAFDLGLPKELASRLRGNDREEMLKDAESLLELVSAGKRPPTKRPTENLRGGGGPEREPEETDTKKIAERMFSR